MRERFIDRFGRLAAGFGLLLMTGVSPVAAQIVSPNGERDGQAETDEQADNGAQTEPEITQDEGLEQSARTADTGIGEVGQRQTGSEPAVLQQPLGRITSRINTRIENRIRNRIDRNYDPTQSSEAIRQPVNRQFPD